MMFIMFLLKIWQLTISNNAMLQVRQPENAYSPMLVTELEIVMLVRPVHSKNAWPPMLVTEFGIVMLVSPVQPENAWSPMLVTE